MIENLINKFVQVFLKIAYKLALLYWFIFRPISFGAIFVIFNSRNEVLLVKHSYKKFWMFPGGTVKDNEDGKDTAVREIKEELNISVFPTNLKKIHEFKSNSEYKRNTNFVYKIHLKNPEIKIDNREITQFKWFPIDKLPKDSSQETIEITNKILLK